MSVYPYGGKKKRFFADVMTKIKSVKLEMLKINFKKIIKFETQL
jgi:hypothetical protein